MPATRSPDKRFQRGMSKVICCKGITEDLIDYMERQRARNPGEPPAGTKRKTWDQIRVPVAEMILKHLDAYDQRG